MSVGERWTFACDCEPRPLVVLTMQRVKGMSGQPPFQDCPWCYKGMKLQDPDHAKALRARNVGATAWSPIERGVDPGGVRDFLDGEPIHCGDGLELQEIEWHADDFGEYTLRQPHGVRVRYEVVRNASNEVVPMLHVVSHGWEFRTPAMPGMRFRWPVRPAGGRPGRSPNQQRGGE